MIWLLLSLFAVVGMGLIARGVRGRRIDNHPVCCACGFDLVGIHGRAQNCPECGADVSKVAGIRIGNRRRRAHTAAIGIALILIALSGSAIVFWSATTGFDWNTVKPAWLLLRELRAPDALAARDELLARDADGRLNPDRRRQLIAHALSLRADPQSNWDQAWGTYLTQLVEQEQLTDEEMGKLVAGMVNLSLRTRPMLPEGEKLPVYFDERPLRGIDLPDHVHVATVEEIILNGMPMPEATFYRQSHVSNLGYYSRQVNSGMTMYTAPLDLPPGDHLVRITLDRSFRRGSRDGPVVAAWRDQATIAFTVMPRDWDPIRQTSSPELDEQMQKAFTVRNAHITRGEQRTSLMLELATKRLPVDCAFDVLVRDESGRESRIGTLIGHAGHDPMQSVLPTEFPRHFGPIVFPRALEGNLTVILRSDPRVALMDVDMDEIWRGEVEIPLPSALDP